MLNLFESLKWQKVSRDEFDITELTRGVVTDLDDVWPDPPRKFRIHLGNVSINGPARFGADSEDDNNLYVIEGDLAVKGPLRVRQGDCLSILHVTGSVTCEHGFVEMDGSLIVGGALAVDRLLVTDIHDQGMLVVHGRLGAQAWLEVRGRGFIDIVELACEQLLFAREARFYRAAGRGAEPGEVAYLFDVARAKSADTALLPQFVNGDGSVEIQPLVTAIGLGEPVLQ